jgi:hypothetical protein
MWAGCEAHFDTVMPLGWRWVITYNAPEPEIHKWSVNDWTMHKTYADFVLCPEHYRAFEANFKITEATLLASRKLYTETEGSA